ncbi:primosomal protein N' [Halorhodospira halophila SL1]|uniref:Replication restart protein PriA n=1 Tax=Halorhodospira halophila (strain DSM 244 / SL1) TaxID=349124 RepID=A1WZB9_HALHL|nr:primosomal protein N' [Halorhodospira halophila SL1]
MPPQGGHPQGAGAPPILQVAVPRPLQEALDYRPPPGAWPAEPVGCRVEVPLGRSRAVGIVVAVRHSSDLPASRLRAASAWVDEQPLLDTELLETLTWAARYYRYPLGTALATALPGPLRQGRPARRAVAWWRLDARLHEDDRAVRRAPRQAELRRRLLASGGAAPYALLVAEQPAWQRAGRLLEQAGLLHREYHPAQAEGSADRTPRPGPELDADQQQALECMLAADGYAAFLLEGVTGSGKTEVYLQTAARALAAGRQVLILVPEIGLAPQFLERLRERLSGSVVVLHSGLSGTDRAEAWLAARDGDAAVILGTRSAIFTPLPRPGLIVVDEEHDPSLAQQDGFRYSARDLAVLRARTLDVPVVLGSATPSLESLHNARGARYTHLRLPHRAGLARAPSVQLVDIRSRRLVGGISAPLQEAVRRHLDAGSQVLLFLNRRGYAPVLICHACGWVAGCHRCDARLTYHRSRAQLRCHHCGHTARVPAACPECGEADLRPLGPGTERLEEALAELFPGVGQLRIDRDTTRRRGALEAQLAAAHRGDAQLLIGTQMLAKGHHLPAVTLVAVIDVDQGLFGADFRATERLAQLVVQVAGRAGRGEQPGEVLLQTRHPEHPMLRTLLERGYPAFAEAHLAERQAAGLPPYAALALLRAESVHADAPYLFLESAAQYGRSRLGKGGGVELLGPVPAPMERREGRHRAQLMVRAERRIDLQRFLVAWSGGLGSLEGARQVRWSLDVDPVEMV